MNATVKEVQEKKILAYWNGVINCYKLVRTSLKIEVEYTAIPVNVGNHLPVVTA